MIPSFRAQEMEDAKTRLDNALSGAIATELNFPEAMKTEIEQLQESIADGVAGYGLVQREDAQERLVLLAAQKDVVLFLRRIRQVVGAHLPRAEQLAVRQQYGLAEIRFYGQERLLQILSNIKAVSDDLEDETLKLPAEVITSAETLIQALQEGLEKRRHFKAQKISLREERIELIQQYRRLRTQIYAFLMENMLEGSRDARLIDFGFRPSNLRRNPNPAEEITVVTEVETPEVVSVGEPVGHAG